MPNYLVTGGTGYIGSHTCVELLDAGHGVTIVDNLCNSKRDVVSRIERITGRMPVFVEADLRDPEALDRIFAAGAFDGVLHFAGLKAVGESVEMPLRYYDNNVAGSLVLLHCMARAGVRRLVFSSSATVYGEPHAVPITEDFPLSATNPYGRSKLMIEDILRDLAASDPGWSVALLRYFNPVGAHDSGLIGEDPSGIPNNLMPYVAQVAIGKLPYLSVFGDDYPTHDGTGVRDYIHVVDLARGHLAAMRALESGGPPLTVNLGTGRGHSVMDMIRAFGQASGRDIAYRIVARRPGDIAQCFADPGLADRLIGWRAEKSLADMCADTWRWQSGNPNGFAPEAG